MRIRSKRAFYERWRKGLLGNRPRVWTDAEALAASGFGGTVTAREDTGRGGGRCLYRLPVAQAVVLGPGWTFNESAPDDELVLQGEAARTVRGVTLRYSTQAGLPMRPAMRTGTEVSGASAIALLDWGLTPTSRDDLDALWDLYPDAVVEFSAYARNVGDQPHRNALIWEVRDY